MIVMLIDTICVEGVNHCCSKSFVFDSVIGTFFTGVIVDKDFGLTLEKITNVMVEGVSE